MVSAEFLQNKIERFAASKMGKSAIKKAYGIEYDPRKDISTQARKYSEEMRQILHKHIHSLVNERGEKSLKSVGLEDIIASAPKPDGKGNYNITVSLTNVERDSLWREGYPDGVYDVVGLFFHGYSAKNRVRGEWNGNYIASRVSRDANSFVQDAVDEFNNNMKKRAVAETVGEYAKQ